MTGNLLFPELETELEAARAEYARLSTEIVAAAAAYERAFRDREDGQGRWNAVVTRVNRSCSYGSVEGGGPSGTLSPALGRLLDQERAAYDATGAALTKARGRLKELQWQLSCRSEDITSLERLLYPPSVPIEPAAPRSKPVADVDGDSDVIIFPSGRAV
jgi:hypothetical protein